VSLKDPFDPGPIVAPNADIKSDLGTLWGYLGWGIFALACFALAGCLVMAWSRHRNNQSNEGLEKAGIIFGAMLAFGAILGVVGTITGT
jgi:Na+/proline symporter